LSWNDANHEEQADSNSAREEADEGTDSNREDAHEQRSDNREKTSRRRKKNYTEPNAGDAYSSRIAHNTSWQTERNESNEKTTTTNRERSNRK